MKTRNPDKAPMSKHPARALRAISAALEYGDLVHGERTWVDLDPRLLLDAAMRHLTSAMDPSQPDVDPDSGLHHLAHLGANVELLLELLGVDYQRSRVPERREDAQCTTGACCERIVVNVGLSPQMCDPEHVAQAFQSALQGRAKRRVLCPKCKPGHSCEEMHPDCRALDDCWDMVRGSGEGCSGVCKRLHPIRGGA